MLAKVEVDKGDGENMKLAGHYRVRGFPTVILFIDDEEKGRFSGEKPLLFLRHFLKEHSALPADWLMCVIACVNPLT